ncbi:tetratricopeptide repeat protein [Limnohabitans sp.]|uniref:tetratricopeptide repeat protein n=1 Tax=Limnohabitans sp. TaxID=1907725 RepID=UPI003918F921
MKFRIRAAMVSLLAGTVCGLTLAQQSPPERSALDATLFYQLLIGELQVRQGSAGAGFSIILDAARRTRDPELYQRAVNIALQNRSGDAAMQAAQAWREDMPQSLEPLRYLLQIQLALGKVEDAGKTLTASIAALPLTEQPGAIASVPRIFARVPDKAMAAQTVEAALQAFLRQADTASAAWTTIGRMKRDSGQMAAATEAALQGHAASPRATGPLVLAMSLLGSGDPRLLRLLDKAVPTLEDPELATGYARALLALYETARAREQLEQLGSRFPEHAPLWLLLGLIKLEKGQQAAAEQDLQRFWSLTEGRPGAAPDSGARTDALLALAQIAIGQRNAALASQWLEKLPADAPAMRVALRKADLLVLQGQAQKAREVLQSVPALNAEESRQKLMLQSQWLREQQAFMEAHSLLRTALTQQPDDPQLLNEIALVCEKLGRFDEMEQSLRQVIAVRPSDPQAYNALGYSLADRNVRLGEARALIEKAVNLAPRDPFIRDSLGWVAFRQGRISEAIDLLESAFKARPDAEIAAHLGEVLWQAGRQDEARKIWRQGMDLNERNTTLQETLQRLQVRP